AIRMRGGCAEASLMVPSGLGHRHILSRTDSSGEPATRLRGACTGPKPILHSNLRPFVSWRLSFSSFFLHAAPPPPSVIHAPIAQLPRTRRTMSVFPEPLRDEGEGRDGDDWAAWARLAEELRECKERQRRTWGDVDAADLGRYLAGEADDGEVARIERAL